MIRVYSKGDKFSVIVGRNMLTKFLRGIWSMKSKIDKEGVHLLVSRESLIEVFKEIYKKKYYSRVLEKL